MPDFEDLGCFVIAGLIVLALVLLAACVVAILLIAGVAFGEGVRPGQNVDHLIALGSHIRATGG